jgi:hypothetical protein
VKPLETLMATWRDRLSHPLSDRESVVVGALALGYLAVALTVANTLGPSGRTASVALTLVLLVTYVLVSRIRFDVGAGYVSAEQIAFLPLLFVAPINLLPLLVPIAFALSDLPDLLSGKAHMHRWVNALADSWFVLGSVLTIGLLAPGSPTLSAVPVYAAAVIAQVALGTAAAIVREHFTGRVSWRDELRSAAAAYQLDVMLAPIGLAVALAAVQVGPAALLAIGPLALALAQLARLHRSRCDQRITRHRTAQAAYFDDCRWVEAACQGFTVVPGWRSGAELTLAVAGHLGLPVREQRELADAARAASRIPFGGHGASGGSAPSPPPLQEQGDRLMQGLVAAGVDHLLDTDFLNSRSRIDELVRLSSATEAADRIPEALPTDAAIVSCCRAYSHLTAVSRGRAAASSEVALETVRGEGFESQVVAALRAVVEPDTPSRAPTTQSPWLLGRVARVSTF